MNIAYLGLGSNIGDREAHLNAAIAELENREFIHVEDISEFIRTQAVAQSPQPDYLNAAIRISTLLTPEELLLETQVIEKKLGRDKKGLGEPRTIDIDILLFNQDIICTDDLIIPHPLMHERDFVLDCLIEIAADITHPILEKSIVELKENGALII